MYIYNIARPINIINNETLANWRGNLTVNPGELFMKNERILSYTMSQKLTEEDLQSISAAGTTSVATANGTYTPQSGWDAGIDVTIDM